MEKFYEEIIEFIKKENPDEKTIAMKKNELCKKYGIKHVPTNIQISLNSDENIDLKTKPGRIMSGVHVVALMTSPAECPHGKCIMCPGGKTTPQSYTGKEPAARRGERNFYDPYLQTFNRLEQYVVLGYTPQKIELIIMGGTFPSRTKKYRTDFITYAFKAMNDFSKMFFKKGIFDIKKFKEFFELPGEKGGKREKKIQKKLLKIKGKIQVDSLEKAQEFNDKKSFVKCVGMTIETRPDYISPEEFLRVGATRIELGVQSTNETALKKIKRGHGTKESAEAIKKLKNYGFKLNFHIMPGLPGVDFKDDKKSLEEIFKNPDYRPDMLKIYPTLVMKGTELYNLWKRGKYTPLTTEKAVELLNWFMKKIPKYCRVMRVQRDIPSNLVEAGVKRTNLRQYLKDGKNEIRGRQIGIKNKKAGEICFEIIEYSASGGKEFFISLVDKKSNVITGFCRLRFPSDSLDKAISRDLAFVRELHVYGEAEQIGKKGETQHRGFGAKLMKKAEEIAKKNRKKKIIVISGVGVRQYYRKLGYKKEGYYMSKKLV